MKTLNYEDTMLQERGYALENKSGYYVHDPVLGLVLAKAIEMGIQLVAFVAYEAPYGTDDTTIPDAREEIQAENLYQRIYFILKILPPKPSYIAATDTD